MRRLGERDLWGLPVLARGSRLPVGVVHRAAIMQTYSRAVATKTEEQHTLEQTRLHLTGAHIVDLTVEPGSALIGKRLNEISLPHDCVIASIRRGSKLIVPRGATRITEWDVLTVVTSGSGESELRHRLSEQTPPA